MRLHPETLDLDFEVADSDIRPTPQAPQEGSALELLIAQDGKSPITHLKFIPQRGKKRLLILKGDNGEAVKATRVSLQLTKMNYRFRASIPLTELGIEPNKNFIFELVASINALGDAHSGGQCSLSGAYRSGINS